MAIKVVEGVIDRIGEHERNTKNGPAIAYSVRIDDEWYSMGFSKPTYGEGDKVTFVWKANGEYRNGDAKTLEILEKAEPAVSDNSTGTTTGGGSKMSSKDYYNHKLQLEIDRDVRLDMVGARNTAIEFVKTAVELGAIKLGSQNTKPETKYDVLREVVDVVTQEFLLHPANMNKAAVDEDIVTESNDIEED